MAPGETEKTMRNRNFTKITGENSTVCLRVSEIEAIGYNSDAIIINTCGGLEIHVIINDDQTNEKVVEEILSGYDINVIDIYRQ